MSDKDAAFFTKNGAWYVSAAIMLMVLIGVIAILVLPKDKSDQATNTPQPEQSVIPTPTGPGLPSAGLPSEPTTAPEATGWGDTGCNGTTGSKLIPATTPKVTWQPLGRFAAPTSPVYGPTDIDSIVPGIVGQCYQHSPTGAVLAAARAAVESAVLQEADPSLSHLTAVMMARVTPGPERDAQLASASVQPTEDTSGIPFTLTAFRVDACTAERCNVRMIIASSVPSAGEVFVEFSYSLVWAEGDWKLDGQTPWTTPSQVASVPPGYITLTPGV